MRKRLPDEDLEPIDVMLEVTTLEDGRSVAGGYHKESDSFCWKFINLRGEETLLRLTAEAQQEMFNTYARLLVKENIKQVAARSLWEIEALEVSTINKVQSGKESEE